MISETTVIGVTGGIGSGKSTVCALLAEVGAVVIDADQISRQLTAAGGLAVPSIEAEFGASSVSADGSMDRAFMRQLVFSDAQAKHRLESILHPLISALSAQREAVARAAEVKLIVHDVPLLIESFGSWRERLSEVWVVDCAEETQIQRVMARSGLTRDQTQAIMLNQASRAQRLAAADVVIDNDRKTLTELREAVKQAVLRFGL